MNREQLIQKLVNRMMQSKDKGKYGCVPCLGVAEKRPKSASSKR